MREGEATSDPAAATGARELFRELARGYSERWAAAHAWQRAGGRVVGVVGHGVPSELVLAAGALPILVSAELNHPTPLADGLMPDNHGWESRSICERALTGAIDLLDLLVVTRPYGQMYYVLKEVHRQGKAPGLPPLLLFDLVQTGRASFQAYNRTRLDDLRARLERLTGKPLSDAAMREAISAANRERKLLRRLDELRRRGSIAGSAAMQVIGAGFFTDPQAYRPLLQRYLEAISAAAPPAPRPRLLLVPADPLYHDALHVAVEAGGGLVVAEDDYWGARGAELDIDEHAPPLDALLHHAAHKPASPYAIPLEARRAWLLQQIGSGAIDAVVFHVPPRDRSFGWDYPDLKAALDERGCRSLLLQEDVRQREGQARVTAAVKSFVEEKLHA